MYWMIGWLHGVYCEIKDNEYNDLFFIDGKTVKKHACSTPGCGPICYASGCLSFLRQSEYVLKIRCDQNLFNLRPLTTDSDTVEMHIRISKNQEPKVFLDPGNVNIVASEAYLYRIIERVSYTDAESDAVTLTCTGSDNFRLSQEFGSGTIVLVKDLQNEKSSTFTVNIFATDRRNTVTQSLEIRLIGTTTTTTIISASSNQATPQPTIEVSFLTASTNGVSEELVTQQPSIEVPFMTASTNRVSEELGTQQSSIEVPVLTDSTYGASEELVTQQPSIEVSVLTNGNPTDTLSTKRISTNQLTEMLNTTTMSMRVSIPTNRKPTGNKTPPKEDIHNPVLYIIIPSPGDRIPPNKDIENTVLYIVIPFAVLAIIVTAVIIIWRKRLSRTNGYRKLKENSDDLDEALEAGVENPTYFMITSEKT
ncbi:hypothetical protein ACJMK2_029440 [Sinanodonta woodiana]